MSGSPALEAQLRDGSTLAIEIAEPPIDRSCDWNRLCWWPLIREEMMEGKLNRWMHAPHFIGRIGGEIAGTMCYYAPEDTRDVGALQFVSTEERFRRRGVGSALVGALIGHFTAQGGRALYLCTTNPVAGHLYESHGFRYHVGDGMRFLAPGAADFDRRWFAGGAATIRDAHWGDLARLCVLYNHPDPAWLIKDALSASFRDTRYESHFTRVLRATEDGNGAFLVLEADDGSRVVGAVAFRRIRHLLRAARRGAEFPHRPHAFRPYGRSAGRRRRARRRARHRAVGADGRRRGRRAARPGGVGRIRRRRTVAAAAALRRQVHRPADHAARADAAGGPEQAAGVVLRRAETLAGGARPVGTHHW